MKHFSSAKANNLLMKNLEQNIRFSMSKLLEQQSQETQDEAVREEMRLALSTATLYSKILTYLRKELNQLTSDTPDIQHKEQVLKELRDKVEGFLL